MNNKNMNIQEDARCKDANARAFRLSSNNPFLQCCWFLSLFLSL
jgi:hypothetical protein